MPTGRLLTAALLSLIIPAVLSPVRAQEKDSSKVDDVGGWTCEYNARNWITKSVMPEYPEEALKRSVGGVIEVRVGVTNEGDVAKVKVPPSINPLFRRAVVVAAKQWKFRPRVAHLMPPGKYETFRLTFHFIIDEGQGRVELYNPPWESAAHVRIRYSSSECITEWKQWEDVTDEN